MKRPNRKKNAKPSQPAQGQQPLQKSLHEFYTEDQNSKAHLEKKRKEHEKIEQEIFEHLKAHTKKILDMKKGK